MAESSSHQKTGEQEFRALVEHNIDGMVIISHDRNMSYANAAACQLFQRSAEELIDTPINFPIAAGQTTEIDLTNPDGTSTPVEVRIVSMTWAGQTRYLGCLRDLTERRKAEEERTRLTTQMQYAQKLESLGTLAGGIAHDFNNLLMAIVARAGLALRMIGPEAPASQHLEQIKVSGLRGGELANQMLTYAGKGKPVIQTIHVTQLIKDMAHLLRISTSKRTTLTYDLAEDIPLIEADPSQLRQLIVSVLTNASEAIGDKSGTITISTGTVSAQTSHRNGWYVTGDIPSSHGIYIDVRDTGSGMDSETIPKIFDPFFTTKFTGRGLGLAALLGIVRALNGAVAVTSRTGEGTHFRLLFPSLASTPSPQTTSEISDLCWKGTGTALVVDDEEDVRLASQLILEEMGLTVLTAGDGHAGLEVYTRYRHEITLVLLDLTMPRMNGAQLFKEIRQLSPDVPFILSSGYNEDEASKRFQGTGRYDFLQKPYQIDALIAKVRKTIELIS
ncbi:MAG: hypothetical protein NPIRA05_08300 [Nitrospirales bacterium]|nr:MAG: hypothetical protein NPIRA05_08300 [Nitrospirales bacterium]